MPPERHSMNSIVRQNLAGRDVMMTTFHVAFRKYTSATYDIIISVDKIVSDSLAAGCHSHLFR